MCAHALTVLCNVQHSKAFLYAIRISNFSLADGLGNCKLFFSLDECRISCIHANWLNTMSKRRLKKPSKNWAYDKFTLLYARNGNEIQMSTPKTKCNCGTYTHNTKLTIKDAKPKEEHKSHKNWNTLINPNDDRSSLHKMQTNHSIKKPVNEAEEWMRKDKKKITLIWNKLENLFVQCEVELSHSSL